MQEEVTGKTVTLIVNGAKMSEQVFEKAVKKFLEEIQKSRQPKIYRGKQTLKQLASQNAGFANIEISDKNIKAFTHVAKKYPETTNYTYHGKLLTHMTVDYTDFDEVAHQDKMHFFYDAQSRPAKVEFNGTAYTYLHNLQGDVVGLLDSSGTLVVEYKYDAWGKPLSTTGTLADTLGKRNPFRYRSYAYDEENGLYYLRNRFYHPSWGKFINPDDLFSANLYAY